MFESAVLPRSLVDRDHPTGLSESGRTELGLSELGDLRFQAVRD